VLYLGVEEPSESDGQPADSTSATEAGIIVAVGRAALFTAAAVATATRASAVAVAALAVAI